MAKWTVTAVVASLALLLGSNQAWCRGCGCNSGCGYGCNYGGCGYNNCGFGGCGVGCCNRGCGYGCGNGCGVGCGVGYGNNNFGGPGYYGVGLPVNNAVYTVNVGGSIPPVATVIPQAPATPVAAPSDSRFVSLPATQQTPTGFAFASTSNVQAPSTVMVDRFGMAVRK